MMSNDQNTFYLNEVRAEDDTKLDDESPFCQAQRCRGGCSCWQEWGCDEAIENPNYAPPQPVLAQA